MAFIRKIMYSTVLRGKSRVHEKDFTRNRKVGFVTLLCIIVNMVRRSTQLEVDEYLRRFGLKGTIYDTYTKQSFSEARQKLSPEAFIILGDGFVEKFYEDDDFKKYKGYRLLAADGSTIEVPNNIETQKYYGCSINQSKDVKIARAISSKLYDVENKIVISATLGRYDTGERELAVANINKMLSFKQDHIKNLILFDRGYPSIALIEYLNSKGIRFLMRTSGAFYKEQVQNTKTRDEYVEIEITKARAKELKYQRTPIQIGTKIKLRVLRVELESGEIEVLITNLSQDELVYEEAKQLYFKRWGIETKFDELKNKFEIENFSGEKPIIVEQDFYATVLLSNIASIFEMEAEEELKEQNSKKELKHEYKINKNILVGKLKNTLIEMLLEDDEDKKSRMYERFIEEIKRNVVPVIPGRNFGRNKNKKKANKYSKNRRRAL